ncbi:MAG: 3-dehydroquinate synthase [Eubacteriaceae bacterium]|nr:3-dehydroquinate synthase [Eubacteriaceae bacterium]
MKKFTISTSKPYDVIIDRDILSDTGKFIGERFEKCKACVITDNVVNSYFVDQVVQSLNDNGFKTTRIIFPNGEHSKSLNTYAKILEALAEDFFTRTDIIVAVGGGIVGDIAGFAAATYLRGISYVQIPTTYLSAIDSSVGGKTSVNLLGGKNLVGAYWQPSLVLCDYGTFDSLAPEYILEGKAEAAKSAIVSDANLIPFIQSNDFQHVVERCISIKKSIVEADEGDRGLRQLLNFGHTIGHGIEKLSAFTVSHGQAVAKGMVVETKAAYAMGLTPNDISAEISTILEGLGFDLSVSQSSDDLYRYALTDKKIFGDKITVVVPESIGKCKLHKLPMEKLREFIDLGMK